MKITLIFPIRDTPTDNMTLRLKCKHLTPILAVAFVLIGNVATQKHNKGVVGGRTSRLRATNFCL